MKRLLGNAFLVVIILAAAAVGYQYFGTSAGKAPSNTAHTKHEQHTEGAVQLSDAKIAAAGIELVKAQPATLHDALVVNGILQPNQEALVQVTPRFPGVVREVNKRIGDRVAKGEVLARVESNNSLTIYQIVSPLAGTVIDRQVALGEHIGEEKAVFIIADLSVVWVDFSIYRRDLRRIKAGDTVVIDAEDDGPKIETKIAYISPVGNSDTQSALARAVVPNNDLRLRPGLFVTGRVLLSAKPVEIAIKASALQTIENRTVVFVRVGDKFETRDVEIGSRDAELVEVVFGLNEGDVYAAKNSFIIKAEIGKGSAAHEH